MAMRPVWQCPGAGMSYFGAVDVPYPNAAFHAGPYGDGWAVYDGWSRPFLNPLGRVFTLPTRAEAEAWARTITRYLL